MPRRRRAAIAAAASPSWRRQPAFVVAVAAAIAYGVMNLLMAATPLAMQRCGLPFRDAALVIEWHVLGMFVPAFFTGHLIQRFGTLRVMVAGVLFNRLRRHRADGARAGTLPGGLAAAGHRLELPLHRRDHAADHHLTSPRAHARRARWTLRLQHHRRHLVRLQARW